MASLTRCRVKFKSGPASARFPSPRPTHSHEHPCPGRSDGKSRLPNRNLLSCIRHAPLHFQDMHVPIPILCATLENSKSHLDTLHQPRHLHQVSHPASQTGNQPCDTLPVKKLKMRFLKLTHFSHPTGRCRRRNRRPAAADAAQLRLPRPHHRHHRPPHQHHPRLGPHRRAGPGPRARVRFARRAGPAARSVLRARQGGGALGEV